MAKVEIYRPNKDGTQRVAAVCRLEGTVVVCEGEDDIVQNLSREGIWDRSVSPPVKLFPSSGRRFLELLRYNLKSGYLNASGVQEEG